MKEQVVESPELEEDFDRFHGCHCDQIFHYESERVTCQHVISLHGSGSNEVTAAATIDLVLSTLWFKNAVGDESHGQD